jgi:hypothetical protein
MLREETDGANTEVTGWGLAQQRAKQKAFVTLLAIAPSPVFYWAAKMSQVHLGDIFAALKNGKEERGKAGLFQGAKHCARWRKKGVPALAGLL